MNEGEGARLRVLVVDDNVDGADALSAVLQALDCVTAVTYDGPAALTSAATFVPHLAFIDLEMPGMNGREVVSHLRANHPDRNVRFVCLTGSSHPEARRLCLEAGFHAFVPKPMQLPILDEMLVAAKAGLKS